MSNIGVRIVGENPIVLGRPGKLRIWELSTRVFEDREERYPLSHLSDLTSRLFHLASNTSW